MTTRVTKEEKTRGGSDRAGQGLFEVQHFPHHGERLRTGIESGGLKAAEIDAARE